MAKVSTVSTRVALAGRGDRLALGWLVAIGAMGVWVVWRLPILRDWTETFKPTVEFDAANAARTVWFAIRPDALEPWQQAWLDAGVGRFIEPPLLQLLTALTYLPGAVERPWTSTVFTSAAWLLAGALLFDVCRRRVGAVAGLVALAYFLFAPFALEISRSFQVESFAVLGLLATLWFAERGEFLDSPGRFWATAAVAGAAGLLKPGAYLLLLAALLIGLAAERSSLLADPRRAARLAALVLLAWTPGLLYGAVFLQEHVGPRLVPSLLLSGSFYAGWFGYATHVAGSVALAVAVAGFAAAPRLRAIGIGLVAAYFATSLAITWHTMTHDYYQVPLLPITALGLAGATGAALAFLRARRVAAGAVLLIAALVALPALHAVTPARGASGNRFARDAAGFAALGDQLGRGQRILAYTYNYAYPLMYYSGLLASSWPTSGDRASAAALGTPIDPDELLAAARRDGVRYFVISRGIAGADAVRDYVAGRAGPLCEARWLWVYDLRAEPDAGASVLPPC